MSHVTGAVGYGIGEHSSLNVRIDFTMWDVLLQRLNRFSTVLALMEMENE
jgi:hypothetical protein